MFNVKGGKSQQLTRKVTSAREVLQVLLDVAIVCWAALTASWLGWLDLQGTSVKKQEFHGFPGVCMGVLQVPVWF